MTRIVICGIRGRMGGTLLRLARERADIEIVGGIGHVADPHNTVTDQRTDDAAEHESVDRTLVVTLDDAPDMIAQADVVIDFSAATATQTLMERAADAIAGRALVVGTTGLSDETRQRLDALSARAAVLSAANFSVGVNLLVSLAERVARTLDPAGYDIEIVEAHHRGKADAPSGTALALAEAAAKGRGADLAAVRRDRRTSDTGARVHGEIGFHSVRGGGIAGEHRMLFAGDREVIELRHEALDRAVFADGALAAARWIGGREPGRYEMRDVLGL